MRAGNVRVLVFFFLAHVKKKNQLNASMALGEEWEASVESIQQEAD